MLILNGVEIDESTLQEIYTLEELKNRCEWLLLEPNKYKGTKYTLGIMWSYSEYWNMHSFDYYGKHITLSGNFPYK